MNFTEWLENELEERGWSRSEAARRGGISASMFDKVLNGYSKPGMTFYQGVSRAFSIPLEEVLRRAGVLPASPDDEEHPPGLLNIIWAYLRADPETRRQMEDFAEWSARENRRPETRPGEERT